MEKGLLLQQTFQLNSPRLKAEIENFGQILKQRMQEYGVSQFLVLEKRSQASLEIAIVPCAQGAAQGATQDQMFGQLAAQGFHAAGDQPLQDFQQYSSASIAPVMIEFAFPDAADKPAPSDGRS